MQFDYSKWQGPRPEDAQFMKQLMDIYRNLLLGLSRLATVELRRRLNALNRGIGGLAADRGFLLADLERLFHGHGVTSREPWLVYVIEPNLAGATAIAEHWYELLTSDTVV